MPVASVLLIEPDDETTALLRDQGLGERHLLAAVALHTVEDVGAEAVRVHAADNLLPVLHLTPHQRDALPVPVLIEELPKRAEQ